MSVPPKKLDGAKVVCWAWSGEMRFGVVKYDTGGVVAEIFGLAICQYEARQFYRFSCDRNWNVIQDTDHDSIEEAKEMLPQQYREVAAEWIDFEETSE